MRMTKSATLAATLAAVLVSGCAVIPEPFLEAEIGDRVRDTYDRVDADQEPVSGPIDLYEAMARALKYNLDHRVEIMEAALRVKELDLSHYSLLPNAVVNSGFAERNNDNASNSVNVVTGAESLATSTSEERRFWTDDVTFSWNVLDFGLSYVRARQAADKFLIAEEMRRKVAERIVEDVRTAYWRAVSADRLLGKLRSLEARVRQAQADSRQISEERETSPITAVTYERELVEIKRTIEEIERDLVVARTQLSSLMNLKPGTRFKLVPPSGSPRDLQPSMSVDDMIWTALHNRPELREVWYRQRINDEELRAALLELLPGIGVYGGANYDSNDFLYNSNWLNWGARASWNLLKVFSYPAKREVVETQDALLDERSLAVSMAIVTQVHVSRIRFLQYRKEMRTALEYLDVQKRLVGLLRREAEADRVSEQTLIREEMNALVAETKRDIAYASLQNAFANLFASMGYDPVTPDIADGLSVKELSSALRQMWFERGDFSSGRPSRTASAAK